MCHYIGMSGTTNGIALGCVDLYDISNPSAQPTQSILHSEFRIPNSKAPIHKPANHIKYNQRRKNNVRA